MDKPYLQNSPLLLVADCAALACPGAIKRNLPGRTALLLCPKLEDKQEIIEKLAQIINTAHTPGLHLVHMKIPCCALPALVAKAQEMAGKDIPVTMSKVSIYGHEDLPGLGGTRP